MKFNFDKIIPRSGTNSVKYDLREKFFGRGDVIPMWVADMDFEVPSFVTEALKNRSDHPIYGYSVLSERYFDSIIGWQKRRHGWDVNREWIIYTPGVVTALNLLVEAFTGPGDKVIIQSPVYFPFFWAVERNHRVLLNNQLREKDNCYFIDFDDLEKKIGEGARLLILCSPHNPVGRSWTQQELHQIGKMCLENNVLIISDEIHCDLVIPGQRHFPLANVSEELGMNTITCIAPSKTFNLAGLFTSSVIIPNESLRTRFKITEERVHLSPNIFGMVASEAVYSKGDAWLEELLAYVTCNARMVEDYFHENLPQVKVSPLEATYLLWIDFRGLGLSDDEVKKILVEKAGVGLNPGAMFGPGGEGFQRMNIGCPKSVVREAIERIARAFR